LEKLLAESKFRALGIYHLESHKHFLNIEDIDDQPPIRQIQEIISSSVWYGDIVSYLMTLQFPKYMTPSKERTLKLHAVKYCIIDSQLYWKDPLGFLLRCLIESKT
jgi:hypothetical protein